MSNRESTDGRLAKLEVDVDPHGEVVDLTSVAGFSEGYDWHRLEAARRDLVFITTEVRCLIQSREWIDPNDLTAHQTLHAYDLIGLIDKILEETK